MTKEERDLEEGTTSREWREADAALKTAHQKLNELIRHLREIQEDLGTFRENLKKRNTMHPIPPRLFDVLDRLPTGAQIKSDMSAVRNQQAKVYQLEEKLKSLRR
jgi:hypothetical protein